MKGYIGEDNNEIDVEGVDAQCDKKLKWKSQLQESHAIGIIM